MRIHGAVTLDGTWKPDDPVAWSHAFERNKCREVSVDVVRLSGGRTAKELRYYWAVPIRLLADYTGYTEQEMHLTLCAKFLAEPDDWGVPGKVRTTGDLSTVEMEDYLRRIREWASADLGVYIPEPNEAPLVE